MHIRGPVQQAQHLRLPESQTGLGPDRGDNHSKQASVGALGATRGSGCAALENFQLRGSLRFDCAMLLYFYFGRLFGVLGSPVARLQGSEPPSRHQNHPCLHLHSSVSCPTHSTLESGVTRVCLPHTSSSSTHSCKACLESV